MHRRFAALAFVAALSAPVLAWAAPAPDAGPATGIAVLPLRARGLSPAEYRRLSARLAATFRETRTDVVAPEEIAGRLFRDEKQKAALEEARRLSAEGQEKSHALEHPAALDRYDRAIQIYREHFGEFADPGGLAETYVRRGAERLTVNDQTGARSDFFNAVTCAPDAAPSADDYPPPVVEAWEQARNDRLRRPLAPDDVASIAALGASLGIGTVATARAEKGDRPDDGIAVEISVWPVSARSTPRSSHVTLGTDASADALASAVREVAAPTRLASASPVATPVRVADVHGVDGHVDPLRPPRPHPLPPEGGPAPLWKNKWVWAGAAILAIGAGTGAALASQPKTNDRGYRVIVTPGS